MKFDVILPGTNHIPGFYPWSHALDADGFRRILRTLDESGFHAVSVSEHLAMPLFEVPRLGSYWQDALSTMAFAAAATQPDRFHARGRYRKIGITRTVAEPPRGVRPEQEYLDYLCWIAAEVMPEV
ncbi:hypothetical protein [Nocardia carnea]|uniref:hypothetical protein n=1 Tax=Nocardia carnea TaxID=37328 RepID=UPI0024555033|nr:hypothetical protein [Nocardia carnea]